MTLALLITAVGGAWADNVLYAILDEYTMTLMFGEKPNGAYVYDAKNSNWSNDFRFGIYTAVIDASCRNFDGNSTRYLFYNFKNISSIEGLSNLNTENVTQMRNMFEGCESLTSIDLSNFNTAKVTDMAGMFNSCKALPSIDLSSFNTAKVNSMTYMFAYCSSLTTITVGKGWNTDKVTDSDNMFKSCSKLPNFNSGKTDKTNAFAGEGGYLTADPNAVEVTTNAASEQDLFTEAWFEMPTFDATVNYMLVRDMQDEANPVAFSGLPSSGNIVVKKGDDGKYQPIETLTIQLIDPLAAAEAQNIIAADGIEAFLADMKPGYYWIKAVPTDETTSPYIGTVYSSEFTVVEKYDLTVKPANDFSKGKIESVTVGSGSVTIDANTGEATKTGIDPDTEVKVKAKRGYVIDKVEVKKGAAGPKYADVVTICEKNGDKPKYADVVTICEKNGDNKYLISSFFDGTNANITTITKEEAIALAEYLGGGNIRVVYEEFGFSGDRYASATNAAGDEIGIPLSTTNTSKNQKV